MVTARRGGDDRLLGVTSRRARPRHPVAGGEAPRAWPERGHRARSLGTGHERQVPAVRRAAFPLVDVHEVDAGGGHVHQQLAGAWPQRLPVSDGQDAGPANLVYDHHAHALHHCPCRARMRALRAQRLRGRSGHRGADPASRQPGPVHHPAWRGPSSARGLRPGGSWARPGQAIPAGRAWPPRRCGCRRGASRGRPAPRQGRPRRRPRRSGPWTRRHRGLRRPRRSRTAGSIARVGTRPGLELRAAPRPPGAFRALADPHRHHRQRERRIGLVLGAVTARPSSRKPNSKSYTSMAERSLRAPPADGAGQRRASRSYQQAGQVNGQAPAQDERRTGLHRAERGALPGGPVSPRTTSAAG